MWLICLYLSGVFQVIAENIPAVLAAPFALLAILYWRKARECAEKDMKLRRVQAVLLNTTLTIDYARSLHTCPICSETRRQE